MAKEKFELSLQYVLIMYIINVYGLGIHSKKTFTGMVDAVKHIDYMDSKYKKELKEFDEFCLLKLNVVVLQISYSDIHETVLIKRRYIYVF